MKKNATKERLFEVITRLDKTFKPVLNEEILPEQVVTAAKIGAPAVAGQPQAQSPDVQYADDTYKMIAPTLQRIRTIDQFPEAFKGWFSSLGYKPQLSNITVTQVRIDVEQVMRELGYK
jgi:hypothetical protein